MLARRFITLAVAVFFMTAGNTWAQGTYPTRLIKFVVPLTTGGSNDLVARLVAERLQVTFGKPAIVENKPGGAGNVGTEYVAKQPADGYTLLVAPSSHVINPFFFAKLPYDPVKDFEPISLMIGVPFILTVNSSVPVSTVKEFVEYARAHPGLTYGSAGVGQPHHLAAEILKSKTGIEITHIPYKGAAGIVPALLSGEINFTIGAINSLLPHFRSGKLRAIAVTDSKRTSYLPDVPTIAETVPESEMDVWTGALAPAGTPRAIVNRLSTEINRIIQDPAAKEKLSAAGIEPIGTTPERFMEVIKAELVKYAKITKDANIKPE